MSLFIHEEAKWQPAREALEDFFADIDTLRMDVDRAEAKIKLLENSISNLDAENKERVPNNFPN